MNFGKALEFLQDGGCVARSGWNGKDMFLYLVNGGSFRVSREPMATHFGEGTEITYCSHIDMKTADGSVVPWVASQTDILADDWQLVNEGVVVYE